MILTTILKYELVHMNTILLHEEKKFQTQEQIYLIDLNIAFMKSVKIKNKQVTIKEIFSS